MMEKGGAPSVKENRFQCKYPNCPYAEGSLRYFQKYQYLKQHYDKVHAEKIYSCQLCTKSFSTTTLLKSHSTYCGKEFKCSCGVVYKSNEALLTHARRKNHTPVNYSSHRRKKGRSDHPGNMASVLVSIPKGAQLIILHPANIHQQGDAKKGVVQPITSQASQACSSHVLAAVALSELAASIEPNTQTSSVWEKREIATQTESRGPHLHNWLNLVSDTSERIHTSGTQTEELDLGMSNPGSPTNPASPWLGLSAAETQTADEDIVLRPFNLCNIQTQTPWNEMSDEESTEFAHTETQTLLSSFFNMEDSLPECQVERKTLLKQASEDAGTDPMEV